MTEETPAQRAERLGKWLDQPHRQENRPPDPYTRHDRYYILGRVRFTVPIGPSDYDWINGPTLALCLCRSCGTLLLDEDPWKDTHEFRFHSVVGPASISVVGPADV